MQYKLKNSLRLKRDQPWSKFILKCSLIVVWLVLAGTYFEKNYRISYDPQQDRCLPHLISLISLNNFDLNKHDLVAFYSEGTAPAIPEDTKMIKKIMGVPGDVIKISEVGEIFINGKLIDKGFFHANNLGMEISDFSGKAIVQRNEFWVMGTHEKSFDSRYWGMLKKENLIGKAYKVF